MVSTAYYENEYDYLEYFREILFFESKDSLDDEWDYFARRLLDDGYYLGRGHNTRPADLNGDGFHDLIAVQTIDEEHSRLVVFHGGEEPDTIPDWETIINMTERLIGGIGISSGCDVNNDGYHDMLIKGMSSDNDNWNSLYLGGSPMDTIPVAELPGLQAYSMFPDVNGDGYDDWGYYTYLPNENDGFKILTRQIIMLVF